MIKMSEEKETSINDFTRLEWQWLADLITEKLCEQGIEVSTFAFSIEVTYNEEEKDDEMES